MNSNCSTIFPWDIACLRNISINTLHKGDDDNLHILLLLGTAMSVSINENGVTDNKRS